MIWNVLKLHSKTLYIFQLKYIRQREFQEELLKRENHLRANSDEHNE